MMATEVWAVLPMRGVETAKSRLSAIIPRAGRERLARAMFEDVLEAVRVALGRVLVVTPSHIIMDRARAHGAAVLHQLPRGYSAAATAGLDALRSRGAAGALVLPADLPLLQPEDVEALVAALPDGPAIIACSDRHRNGTNALLQSPTGLMSPLFGEGSFERHRAAAAERGLAWRELALPRVAFDVDTPADLRLILHRRTGPATAEVLDDLWQRIEAHSAAPVSSGGCE